MPDGTGSAMVLKHSCRLLGEEEPEIFFLQYGDKVPDLKDKDVIMCDFSFDRDTIIDLHDNVCKSLLVIDHHASAEKELKGLDYCIFDMKHSGAMLAWKTFFSLTEPPEIIKYIEDRDIWKWKLEDSKEFSSGFMLYSQDTIMNTMSTSEFFVEEFKDICIAKGKPILEYQNNIINKAELKVSNVKTIEIDRYLIPSTNSTHLISELGNMYSKHYPFSVQFFYTNNEIVFSLRSNDKYDVSILASKYNGGGHKNAAGFSFKIDEFDHNAFHTKGKIRRTIVGWCKYKIRSIFK